jgi:hypothetical protein
MFEVRGKLVVISLLLIFGVMTAAISACAEGKRPFLMVQICLGDARNLALLKQEMRAVAQIESMRFIDGSAETKRGLDIVDKEGAAHELNGPVIHMAVERPDSMGVGASNLGLPGYQVVLGFSEGSNPQEARQFAGRVVDRMAANWRIHTVAPGTGAMPLEDCPSTPQAE